MRIESITTILHRVVLCSAVLLSGCNGDLPKEFDVYRNHPIKPPRTDQQIGALLDPVNALPITGSCVVGVPKENGVGSIDSQEKVNKSFSIEAATTIGAFLAGATISGKSDAIVRMKFSDIKETSLLAPTFDAGNHICADFVARNLEAQQNFRYYQGLLLAKGLQIEIDKDDAARFGIDLNQPLKEKIALPFKTNIEMVNSRTVKIAGSNVYFAYLPKTIRVEEDSRTNVTVPVGGIATISNPDIRVRPLIVRKAEVDRGGIKMIVDQVHFEIQFVGKFSTKPLYPQAALGDFAYASTSSIFARFEVLNLAKDGNTDVVTIRPTIMKILIE